MSKEEDDDEAEPSPPATNADESPSRPRPRLIVGLGASAGGLDALQVFFDNLPVPNGLAFVVVTHQHPGHTSLMPELIGKHTTMPVTGVLGATPVLPDHVYVATPGANLGMLDGVLHRIEVEPGPALVLPIDSFFRSLANDAKHRAVGIILSGTGTDGTVGIKEIKGVSGMVMVQAETSAAYTGMPRSALATKLVDYVSPVGALPEQLLAYAAGPFVAPASARKRVPAEPAGEQLQQILLSLRDRTGHDFSSYKLNTVRRRIERRMNVHQLDDPDRYLRYLQANPAELDLLFKELLIGVTSFFRDPEAFAALANSVLPELIRSRPQESVFRAWVPGCSTGEEAYSLAMLVRECLDAAGARVAVQIFATDIDAEAVETARAGIYPEGIAVDVTPPRLERFFVREEATFRVRKDLREMLVFAPQSVIDDPPFTKLDLLSCRNLLIYLDVELQRRLLPMFHYSLRPGGVLFLGSSESLGASTPLFDTVDKKWRLFRRREVEPVAYVAEFPGSASVGAASRTSTPTIVAHAAPTRLQAAERVLVRELVPPSLIIHERGDIAYVHGHTGRFLEPAPGTPTQANVFNMAREGLQIDLAAGLRQCVREHAPVVRRGVRVRTNADVVEVDLRLQPIERPEAFRGLFLVSFENARLETAPDPSAQDDGAEGAGAGGHVQELERELQHTREIHQGTIEELETANEELKSTNEELQSTNEELQSANEKLETSKEEMQSLNEELLTVNAELQSKVDELSQANDDMRNLLNGTDIATLFLDNELRIKRFTEQAKRVIKLIPSDVGRPIGDLASNLRYDRLEQDAREVLETLNSKETEVEGQTGTWYLMRVLPYRTTENVIEGLVITFADTTRIRRLEDTAGQLQRVLETSPTSVSGQDRELRYEWGYGRVFGHEVDEVIGKTDADLLASAGAERLAALKSRVLRTRIPAQLTFHLQFGERATRFHLYVEPRIEHDEVMGIASVVTDVGDD